MSIYCVHGMLGNDIDWDPLKSLLPQYSFHFVYPEQISVIPTSSIVIAYSMGARMVLHTALKSHSRWPIIFALSPNLFCSDRSSRKEWELLWKNRFLTDPDAIEMWYQQPIFKHLRNSPHFLKLLEQRTMLNRSSIAKRFDTCSLSALPDLLPYFTSKRMERIHFIYGAFDKKYMPQYDAVGIQNRLLISCGHVIHIEDPSTLAEYIKRTLHELNAFSA